jgi:hypothetical protein
VSDTPAEILGRLRPIPTTVGPPTTRPRDIDGVRPDGSSGRIDVMETAAPVLLLFLSAGCLGCRDLWQGLAALQGGLGSRARLAVVTKGPEGEDPAAIAALAGEAPAGGVDVVMSTPAFDHYRAAAPFLVVATSSAVLSEGVAWGVDETVRTTLTALDGAT